VVWHATVLANWAQKVDGDCPPCPGSAAAHYGDAVWVVGSGGLKEPCVRWGPDSRSPMRRTILRGKGAAHCKL